jgi:hypothetical protein
LLEFVDLHRDFRSGGLTANRAEARFHLISVRPPRNLCPVFCNPAPAPLEGAFAAVFSLHQSAAKAMKVGIPVNSAIERDPAHV